MVKICPNIYNSNEVENINEYFCNYENENFRLSPFQKWTIEAIVKGKNVLNCAHTGSGKTLGAEFAINYFTQKGKKVIYTSPIKALSNQKFYEFNNKFPNISFGILTGDIKNNPEANVLIMTTEILLNNLYSYLNQEKQEKQEKQENNFNNFNIDYNNELACVIFDEIHFINDKERGKIWEETIMILPSNIQLIMLSATLSKPEDFAFWIENIKNKEVYLTSTSERIVPLEHYIYFNSNNGLIKKIKNNENKNLILNNNDKFLLIQDNKNKFNIENNKKIISLINLTNRENYKIKKNFILNEIVKKLKNENMLPAIIFVLNRKLLEIYANEININLFNENDNIHDISLIENYIFNIIKKLPNYKEYINLIEYQNLINLANKGIAIHHAGIIPIFREITELLFQKGFIKLLFATETFALGINMPTKSVIFTSLNKYDGTNKRLLYSHEYTQMAGRAGRRGIDNIGYVIHCSNFYSIDELNNMNNILKGVPQKIFSKFKISYILILNLLNINENNIQKIINYIKKSILQNEINNENITIYNEIQKNYNDLNKLEETLNYLNSPKSIVQEYIILKNLYNVSYNKKRQNIIKQLNLLEDEYKNIIKDVEIYENYNTKLNYISKLEDELNNIDNFFYKNINYILNYLIEKDFIYIYENVEEINEKKNNEINNSNKIYKLNFKGNISLLIKEVNTILFTNLILENKLNDLNSIELTCFFSCFCDYKVNDNLKINNINELNEFINLNNLYNLKNLLIESNNFLIYENELEIKNNINSGLNYNINYDLIDIIYEYYNSNNEEECKLILINLRNKKEIFAGEFIKIILKIYAIINELINVCNYINNNFLLSKLNEIINNILKFIVINQSLYV